MQRKSPKLLADIRTSASFILQSTSGKNIADYQSNSMLRAAVERHFEIIGEAINRLAREDLETASRISDYPRIVAFRNVLIHGYDLVDDIHVWRIIVENLPTLRDEAEALLREVPDPE